MLVGVCHGDRTGPGNKSPSKPKQKPTLTEGRGQQVCPSRNTEAIFICFYIAT